MKDKISISIDIEAPVEKVWKYWTVPKYITQWNFATEDWCCPKAENDLRVGGKYLARMEAKDGSFGFDFEATYNQVEKFKKIKYTIADGREVMIDFENFQNKTRINMVFDTENQNSIGKQQEGWEAILRNFKTYTENK
ncbi:SRPBCC domain-containing protein [Mesonia sp. MT50]|uniref:SRPBCC domain-containing protein n=1 Tax=Mesonia profundi TaxID=3070998 RepID=A0ABU1A6N8_9FLAO|nr:SRPBCC domain-containing protein [Mesonia profundi]MDQ7918656.1 SRPBCC domain-containing protein [Mesonia profundi]